MIWYPPTLIFFKKMYKEKGNHIHPYKVIEINAPSWKCDTAETLSTSINMIAIIGMRNMGSWNIIKHLVPPLTELYM